MGNKDNQDYFKRGGRSGGPAGTRSQLKSRFTTKRAILTRDQEHRLPGERPLSGKRPEGQASERSATEEAEAQLASLDEERTSVLDSLPNPTGTVGLPRSAKKPARAASGARSGASFQAPVDEDELGVEPWEQGTWDLEPREEEAPYGFGIPASEEAALGHNREPFLREAGEMRHAAREGHRAAPLPPLARRALRTFPTLARVMGGAAKVVDRPIRRTLDTLQRIGDEAARHS